MIFRKKSKTPVSEPPQNTPPRWDCAKWISEAEASDLNLPLGWYLYQMPDSQQYSALRPHPIEPGRMEKISHCQLPFLEKWLGLPRPELPQEKVEATRPALDEFIRQAQRKCAFANQNAPNPPRTSVQVEAAQKRSHRVCIRMNEAEYNRFQNQLYETGMTAQSFVLSTLQHISAKPEHEQLMNSFAELCEELDCQIALYKEVLECNAEQEHIDPEGWQIIVNTLNSLQEMKADCIQFTEEQNGNH